VRGEELRQQLDEVVLLGPDAEVVVADPDGDRARPT
jgi:hypothetical protein